MRLDRESRGRGGRRGRGSSQQVDPMGSVANLVDIMLVFICGLMIAIIMFWNVDLDNLQDRQDDAYQDMGQVYQDPETGKIYVIKPADDGSSAQGADTGDTEADSGADGADSAENTAGTAAEETGGGR